MNSTWEKIVFRILDGEKDIQSPYDQHGTMKSLFVVVNQQSRMGYAWIWCSSTFKGIWLSRMKIPAHVDYVTSTEDLSKRIVPRIDFVDPV